jgi:aryl-alcohol dehydrogenase-like predicted oxidoreductase
MDRAGFEDSLAATCQRQQVGVATYFSLASGFLTGKYRRAEDAAGRPAPAVSSAISPNAAGASSTPAGDGRAARQPAGDRRARLADGATRGDLGDRQRDVDGTAATTC